MERLHKFAMFDSLLIKHGFEKCLPARPTKRSQKMHWIDDHKNHVYQLIYTHFDIYSLLKESLNLGIGGECTQHIIWRTERLPVPNHLKYVIIHCGTNSISKDCPSEIANSILYIALLFKKRNSCLKIIITGIFPRDDKFSRFRIIVPQINQLLKNFTSTYDFIDFLEPTKDWLKYNGDLNNKLFWTDHLHLSKFRNKKFASSIFTLLQQYKIVSTYPKLVLASSVVCNSFILSQCVFVLYETSV